MIPIRGWVIDDNGVELSIKLKSGPIIRIPKRPDMGYGDVAFVCYDYERHVVRQVWSAAEARADDEIEEVPPYYLDLPWEIPTTQELIETQLR